MVSIGNGTIPAPVNGHATKAAAVPPTSLSNGNLSEVDAFWKRKTANLCLEVRSRVNCRWRDGEYHPIKVIEHHNLFSDGTNDYEYYVHYTEFNCRLDEWVKLEQLDLNTVETDVDEKVDDKGHEELDAASLREHEEFT